MNETQFPRTWAALRAGITDQVAPGIVAGLWRAEEPNRIWVAAHGSRRLIPSEQSMEVDTVFDLASVSKVMATATLTARLIDRGWVNWETPLQAIFAGSDYPGITLKHLLSHTAGFIWWEPLWERLRERFGTRALHTVSVPERQSAMRELVFRLRPEASPGIKAVYSDISFLMLGFALEEITRMPLDQAVRQLVWDPMGVEGAFYTRTVETASAAARDHGGVAATENCPWRGAVLQGQVHDDNCWAMGGYGGHAGVFATARDVLHFAGSLLSGFLQAGTLAEFWRRVNEPPGCERTPGWDTPAPASENGSPSSGKLFSTRSVGHLGFTGTSLWIDPDARLAVTLLTNRVHFSRENVKIRAFRPLFHDALRGDLRDQ